MHPSSRKIFRGFHVYTAFAVSLLLVSMAITGAILAFRSPLEPKIFPKLLVVQPDGAKLSYDKLVSIAVKSHPSSELDYIRYFSDPTAPFLVRFTNKDFVYINPYSGEVLGQRNRYGNFFGWLEGFHRFLMMDPKIMEPVIGSVSLILFLIALTGMVLNWPATKKAFFATIKLNSKLKNRAKQLNIHRMIGFYALIFIFIISLTGAPQALEWVKSSLFYVTSSHVEKAPIRNFKKGEVFVGMEAMALCASKYVPDASEVLIHFPEKGLVEGFMITKDAPHPNARNYIWINPTTAKPVKFISYADDAMGRKLAMWALSIHTGQVGGLFAQICLFLGAISILVLTFTGIYGYVLKKARVHS